MSLTLSSSHKGFDIVLEKVSRDGATSPVEFAALRDIADKHVMRATGLDTADPALALGTTVVQFLYEADAIVECMQRVAIEARKKKLSPEKREELKLAIEHQIAYIVAGYQSSIQRL